jgi:hypothetical protein
MTAGMVSFVVIAFNEEAHIAATLASISRLSGLGAHEIIVVNDGSRDATGRLVAAAAADDPCIRLIDLPRNRGRGYARHVGIAAARGNLIATVDADILLPADWLERTSAALGTHDAVGGTAVPDGDVAYLYRRFRLAPRVVSGTTPVTGNNGLYRRAVFDRASFDPALREGEDSALNQEMQRRGLSSATLPGLLVEHQESKSLATSLKWLFDVGRGATRQLVTYRQVRQPDLVTAAFIGSVAAGAALARRNRLTGIALPVGFIAAASLQHVRSRFETPQPDWPRVAPAVAVNGALLTAYFAGRLAGLTALRQRPLNTSGGRPGHAPDGGRS